jgi:hypothetical protein
MNAHEQENVAPLPLFSVFHHSLREFARASTPTDSNWDARADMNYDGVVDYKNLFLLERNYQS